MTELPRAMLFDLDETIISFGDRRVVLSEIVKEFATAFSSITPSEVVDAIEAANSEFWSDPQRHKIWRFRLREARVHIVSGVLAEWRGRCPGLTPELAREFAERFHNRREGQAILFPEALSTLDELKRRGVKLALVTNGDARGQRRKIDHFDLAHRFEHIQIESEAGFGKPEEQAYLHAMGVLGVTADSTWMIGDNLEWEVAAPQRVGIYAVWHDPTGDGLPVGSTVVPNRIIRCLSELLVVA